MKLTVKTLKGTHFDIQVQPTDTVIFLSLESLYSKLDYGWFDLISSSCNDDCSLSLIFPRFLGNFIIFFPLHLINYDLVSNSDWFQQVMAVKKNIEAVQGSDSYPWGQQLLIYSGKVLKDETQLKENNVSEDGFLVVMLSKV